MDESIMPAEARQFSPCASLAALGVSLQDRDVFGPIRERLVIAQKTVKHTPLDKVYDAFITLLAGAHGLVEINTRLRSDRVLQAAFGRASCAEQSVVQQTLDACTTKNVGQLAQALQTIYRRHSQGYRHDYSAEWQILDVDMSGLPCGRKAALATKGYFAKQRNRRGRQLGRVLATRYDEVVVDQLYSGTTQLSTARQPLVTAAAQTLELELDAAKRARTIVRVDAGGGSLDDVNWLLEQGYAVHAKEYSSQRARALAESVTEWIADPRVPGRQMGWVTTAPTDYVRPVRRIAVRCRKKNGQWGVGVVVSALAPADVLHLTGQRAERVPDDHAVLRAYVYFYDQRGGGVETALKGDKQGLGLTARNKKRFAAQQMVSLLSALAHNVIVWARQWLLPQCPPVRRYGILRLVRDIFRVSGFVVRDATGRLLQVVLNEAAPLAHGLAAALCQLLAPLHVGVTLGQI
jgi:hypothetical protein